VWCRNKTYTKSLHQWKWRWTAPPDNRGIKACLKPQNTPRVCSSGTKSLDQHKDMSYDLDGRNAGSARWWLMTLMHG
jgi:hypothetical protein